MLIGCCKFVFTSDCRQVVISVCLPRNVDMMLSVCLPRNVDMMLSVCLPRNVDGVL